MDCPTILQQAVDRRASDIFIVAGTPLTIKINGEMVQLDDQRLTPAMTEALIQEIFKLSQNRTMDRLHQTGEDDFSFSLSQNGTVPCECLSSARIAGRGAAGCAVRPARCE